jgi:hypothetical protein
MRSIEKNRKQGSNLPISIKLVVKIALVAVGFSVWEQGLFGRWQACISFFLSFGVSFLSSWVWVL